MLRGISLLGQGPQKRRVFFSFHYQNDIWRANQVRKSWNINNRDRPEGFYDASLWEETKRKGDDSLKALIREGIERTSVTCVLAGRWTFERRWVRYEIARSVIKQNGLLTVKIHQLRDQNGYADLEGPNPLDYMGVARKSDARIYFCENRKDTWHWYNDFTDPIKLPNTWDEPPRDKPIPLSRYARVYDYVTQNGKENFVNWIHQAAIDIGR